MTDGGLEALREEYAHCFGCGRHNPIGLCLDDFVRDGDTVSAEFVPREDYRGFTDVLHGGIVATAIDEVLAWTAILVAGTMAVTARLELRFPNPAPASGRYLLEGRLVEQRGRRLVMTARCSVNGTEIATARALFIATEALPDALRAAPRKRHETHGKTDTSATPSNT